MVDSRTAPEGVRRRRICNECRRRFTTYEKIGASGIKVLKRDGSSEPFTPEKLVRVLGRVGRDRAALTPAAVQRLARALEAQLLDEGVKSIRSADILLRMLALLADVDRVAHDRLAADYLDEAGRLRTGGARDDEAQRDGQLGLFADEEEEKR